MKILSHVFNEYLSHEQNEAIPNNKEFGKFASDEEDGG